MLAQLFRELLYNNTIIILVRDERLVKRVYNTRPQGKNKRGKPRKNGILTYDGQQNKEI